MKKVGVSTVCTGYNYGSSLQAFATKTIVEKLGFDAVILGISGSMLKGRDVRLNKLLCILFRLIIHPSLVKKTFSTYKSSVSKTISKRSSQEFDEFISKYIKLKKVKYSKLKKMAHEDDYYAFLCGSDQVWNATSIYVDPFYYLRFAPTNKRIAFTPSFGKEVIPTYNIKKIVRYIKEIPYLSIREEVGAELIKKQIGTETKVLIDPTLVLNKNIWVEKLLLNDVKSEKYILSYFLDKPTPIALREINKLAKRLGYVVYVLPYMYEGLDAKSKLCDAGPIEFLNILKNADMVCTDSFHGTAFSINFNIPFYTFERNYGNASNQSSRIVSLLKNTDLENRYLKADICDINVDINFEKANEFIGLEREKSEAYLKSALTHIKERK